MELDLTDEYWKQYAWAKPHADAEDTLNPYPTIPYKQYLPPDPMHPRAFIPNYVRWAKRKELNFTCPITGWKETDYFQDIQRRGPIRLVGRLTADHKLPGSLGGLTTDENIQMICEFANTKKGNTAITNEELSVRLLGTHRKIEEPAELLEMLRKYKVSLFRVGNAYTRIRS